MFSEKIFYKLQSLKTHKHSVNLDLSWCGFYFFEHLNRLFTYVVFYIQNRKMFFSKNIFYQYFVVFLAILGKASSLKTFYIIT